MKTETIKRRVWKFPTKGKSTSKIIGTETITEGIFKKREIRINKYSHRNITIDEFYEKDVQPFLETVKVISINEYTKCYYRIGDDNWTVFAVYYRDL